jgi:hypothetical protein
MEYHGSEVDYVANELIVRLKREVSHDPKARESVVQALPPRSMLLADFDDLGIAVIELPEGSNILDVARALNEHDLVASAEPTLIESES